MHIISFSYKCSPGDHKKVAPLLKKKGKKAGVFSVGRIQKYIKNDHAT